MKSILSIPRNSTLNPDDKINRHSIGLTSALQEPTIRSYCRTDGAGVKSNRQGPCLEHCHSLLNMA
jgi:hypothetical protein